MQRQQHGYASFPAVAIVAALLLGACTMGGPYSTQSIVPGALVDPVLEPLRGCVALTGAWKNQGYELKENRTKIAILSSALGMAEQLPEAAFADRVHIELQDDGSLVLTARENLSVLASLSIPVKNIECEATGVRLAAPAHVQLAAWPAGDSL